MKQKVKSNPIEWIQLNQDKIYIRQVKQHQINIYNTGLNCIDHDLDSAFLFACFSLKLIVRAQKSGLFRVVVTYGRYLSSLIRIVLATRAGRRLVGGRGGRQGNATSAAQRAGTVADGSAVVAIGGFSQNRRLGCGPSCALRRGKVRLRRLRVLRVLLVVWMKVVDCIVHNVSRIHGLLQTTGNALHRHRSALVVR